MQFDLSAVETATLVFIGTLVFALACWSSFVAAAASPPWSWWAWDGWPG